LNNSTFVSNAENAPLGNCSRQKFGKTRRTGSRKIRLQIRLRNSLPIYNAFRLTAVSPPLVYVINYSIPADYEELEKRADVQE